MSWLRAQKVVLPGITVLERDVARVRDLSERAALAPPRSRPDPGPPPAAGCLTRRPARGAVHSLLSSFAACRRRPAVRASSTRSPTWHTLRHLPLTPVLPRQLGLNRLHSLARVALTARAQTLARLADTRRAATLRAALHVLVALAHDTVLDLLDEVFTTLLKARPPKQAPRRGRAR